MMITDLRKARPIREENLGIAVIISFAIMPLSGFATDIYIPSLPEMASSMHLSSIQVQLTLSFFLVSYGLSQLFIGSILDSFGRRRLVLISLLIFAASCVVIAQTRNIYLIYGMRILHGLTMATIVVSKRAFFVDSFTGDKLKGYLSYFSIVWSAGPIIAPFIGGYFQHAFGWTSSFYFLAGLAVVLAIPEYIFSGETLKHFSPFDGRRILDIYGTMFGTGSFVLGILMLGLSYSMVMVYNMTGPFIVEHHLHYSPVVSGYCCLVSGLAWMTGGVFGKATVNRPFLRKLLVNLGLQLALILAMILGIGWMGNLVVLTASVFLIHVTAGYAFNVYFSYTLQRFPKNAGIASGLMGGVMYLVVSLLSYGIVSGIPAKDPFNLSISYLILAVLAIVVTVGLVRVRKKEVIC